MSLRLHEVEGVNRTVFVRFTPFLLLPGEHPVRGAEHPRITSHISPLSVGSKPLLCTYQIPTNSLPTPTMVGDDRFFIGLKFAVLTFIRKVCWASLRTGTHGRRHPQALGAVATCAAPRHPHGLRWRRTEGNFFWPVAKKVVF